MLATLNSMMLSQRGESDPTDPALYALLGVVITACVSLVALLIKHKLDAASAQRDHEHDLRVLQLRLKEDRSVKRSEQARRVYADFLSGTAEIYLNIVEIRRARRQALDDDAYRRSLKAIRPTQCQVALEEVRLLADREVVDLADRFWHHIRSATVPTGADTSSKAWSTWKEEYWRFRGDLLERMKDSLGGGQAVPKTSGPAATSKGIMNGSWADSQRRET